MALDLSGCEPKIRTHRASTCLDVVMTFFCHRSSRFDSRTRHTHTHTVIRASSMITLLESQIPLSLPPSDSRERYPNNK